jgi:hypothetical protein
VPEKIVFFLSTGRTGTKSLAEGLNCDEIISLHQPPFSRLLTLASNYYLHGWLPWSGLRILVELIRESQIRRSNSKYYFQVYPLDYLPAKIISEKYEEVYIIHIIRDPRTFVPSYLNWMHTRVKSYIANKMILGWHPSGLFVGKMPWRDWLLMGEFQRVCWQWNYKNYLLECLFAEDTRYFRISFEDLFFGNGPELLRGLLEVIGIPFPDRLLLDFFHHPKNVSRKVYFPKWKNWTLEMNHQLLFICGDRMKKYGYI